jgi:hypothetical protein
MVVDYGEKWTKSHYTLFQPVDNAVETVSKIFKFNILIKNFSGFG